MFMIVFHVSDFVSLLVFVLMRSFCLSAHFLADINKIHKVREESFI